MKKQLILLVTLLFVGFNSSAQQDEQMSVYMHNPLYFNPAYAGSRDALSTLAMTRFQWVNFDGAPSTQWFSIHAPLLQKSMGIGSHMVNDRIGNRSRTAIYLDVNGSIALNKTSRIAAGISGGIDMMGYDFSDVQVNDQADPYYGTSNQITKPNFGAGVYYYSDNHFFGISVPRVMEINNSAFDTIIQTLNTRHFFISGGTVFDLNSVLKLKPTALLKFTPGAPITADINASLLMYETLWAGVMYRFHESMGANLVYNIKQTFSIGYAYDFPINGLRTYQSGSHEIFLRYDFIPKKSNFTSPRYF